MNGVVFQTSTDDHGRHRRVGIGGPGDAAGRSGRAPSRMSLMMPNRSLNIHAHICAETTVGIAHGISTAARSRPRPRQMRVQRQRDDHAQDRSRSRPRPGRRTPCSRPPATTPDRSPDSRSCEADELWYSRSDRLASVKREPDRPRQRPSRHQRQNDHHRRQEDQRRPSPLPGQGRALRLGGGRHAGAGRRLVSNAVVIGQCPPSPASATADALKRLSRPARLVLASPSPDSVA